MADRGGAAPLPALVAAMFRLALRNRLALVYGFVFPLLFLVGFWAIYRNDPVPLALHAGQFLTVTILGSACFGLPTAMVAEREAGIWRRYRLTPTPVGVFIASTLLVRLALLLAATALQLALAHVLGMPWPVDPLGLVLVLVVAGLAFLGLGAVIAMLVPNVPAVQALGQCIFLPMLIVGGVAVPLASLPDWALSLSVFLPGRHAVAALQACVTGLGVGAVRFELAALVATGIAAFVAATAMFDWQPEARAAAADGRRKLWALAALAAWLGTGIAARMTGRLAPPTREVAVAADPLAYVRRAPTGRRFSENAEAPKPSARPAPGPLPFPPPAASPPPAAVATPANWQAVTAADFDRIAFDRLPPDTGLVAPIAAAADAPDPLVAEAIASLAIQLVDWPAAAVADPVQRVRNLLYVAAVPDLLQMDPFERFVPLLIEEELQKRIPAADLPRLLWWVALHPDTGDAGAIADLPAVGLPAVTGPDRPVRGRTMIYAMKLLARTRPPGGAGEPDGVRP